MNFCHHDDGLRCANCADRVLAPASAWNIAPATKGWQCPGCGRCYNPSYPSCDKCGQEPALATESGFAHLLNPEGTVTSWKDPG